MVLKRIFLILILPIFIYAQWTDPRPKSVQLWHMADGVIDSLTISAFYADTSEAKGTTLSENVGGLIRVNGFTSSSNYGAGLFLITNTSYTPDGTNVFNLNSGSNQLVRLNDPIIEDTTALKNLPPIWNSVYLKKLSSSNTNGSGMFVSVDSIYPEGSVAFGSVISGKQWVLERYKNEKKVSLLELGLDNTGATAVDGRLSKATADLDSGATVEVSKGNYRLTATVNITKPLTLVGEGSFVDSTSNDTIFVIKSSNVTMTDFEIIGKPSADSASWNTAAPAIDIKPSAGQTFSDLEFSRLKISGKRVGIKGWNVHNVLVRDNRVTNVAQGFAFGVRNASTSDSASTNIKILNNYVKHTNGNKAAARGVSTNNVRDLLIQGNTMYGTGMSIENFITTAFLDSALANEWTSDSVGYFLNAKVLDNSLCNTISGASIIKGNTIDGDSLPANCYWQVLYALEPSINAIVEGNYILNTPANKGGVIIFNAMQITNNVFYNMQEGSYAVFYYSSPRTEVSHQHGSGRDVIIKNNLIRQCKRLMFNTISGGAAPDTMAHWVVTDNTIIETETGSYNKNLNDVTFARNTFINSNRNNTTTTLSGLGTDQIAIQFQNCERIAVYDNYFKNTNFQRGAAYSIHVGALVDSAHVYNNRTYGYWGNYAATGNNYAINTDYATSHIYFYNNFEDATQLSTWDDVADTVTVNEKFVMPTHTTTTRDAISSWIEGSMIYNTTIDSVQIYVNGSWENLTY